MTAFLADGNVIVALTVVDHVHHRHALEWFESEAPDLATCPITEGTLVRFLLRAGHSAPQAMDVLDGIRAATWHRFWSDDIPLRRPDIAGVVGHRQVTDAYLVALAKHHGGRLVTFDRGLAAMHGPSVDLLDPSPTA